jgi:hypothetical protein
MATGAFSTSRPATVEPKDVEIYYTFSPSRETKAGGLVKLPAELVLEPIKDPVEGTVSFGGLYQLTLPVEHFSKKGFYNIHIRPKRIKGNIMECGVLSALPDIKGIVIEPQNFTDSDENNLSTMSDKVKNGGLMGYRIEYLDVVNGNKVIRPNYFTVITWSNKCEGIVQNLGNTTQNSTAYKFTDSGNMLFLTVTPSTSPTVKPNQKIDIGVAGQEIVLHNPYFDPFTMEVEITEYDIESLAIFMAGEQTKSLEDGVVTYYKNVDGKREIYKQTVVSKIKNEYDETLYEVKENIDDIDTDKEWDKINDDVIDG